MLGKVKNTDSNNFQRFILWWYSKHGRYELPWRKTTDPYKVLVSELMLQQTQVERVVPKLFTGQLVLKMETELVTIMSSFKLESVQRDSSRRSVVFVGIIAVI
ncbi:MAG: hypothetical protein H6773_00575 [Pseudomonadales bacterium]|nr:hypothetical protein [Candidatus Woesebacteria bacterium]MCB9800656.1 hypothetical protein [Pseudomonadales bacterium]